jgi:hypothetical protein
MKGLAHRRNPGSPISRLFCRSDRLHALEGMKRGAAINLFDNGSLHDYSRPVVGRIGYDGHEIRPTPGPQRRIQRAPPIRMTRMDV